MKYEITFITRGSEDTATAEQHVKTVQGLCDSQKIKVLKTNQWGRRALAYPIKGESFGYYTTIEFETEGPVVNELDRLMRLNRSFIRQLITLGFDKPVALTSEHKEESTETGEGAPRTAEEILRRGSSKVKTTKKAKKVEPKVEVKDEKARKKMVEAALEGILAEDSEATKDGSESTKK